MLVVDDSVVVRRLVSDVLASDPDIEVAGTASNGKLALARLDQLNPDVVTMDVEMPEMDGLATLRELRRTRPRLPVIMFSTLTERGASATLDALSLGANDYVTKPTGMQGTEAAARWLRGELLPRVRLLGGREHPRAAAPAPAALRPVVLRPARPAAGFQHVTAVTIGVSTGGPQALARLMPDILADFPVPILIVQHMPPLFTRLLADRLNNGSRIRVREAGPGMLVEPGVAYIAPGDWHMEVERDRSGAVRLTTHQGPPENSCRPAVDVLFRSVAEVYAAGALAVVLTGMGQDGLRGGERIVDAGGRLIAQDKETSVVWGMPGFVANAGLAERVVPLGDMAGEIVRRVKGATVERGIRAGVEA